MPQELIEMYNSLSEAKRQSASDYITFLYLRETKRNADEVDALLKEANDFAEKSGLQDWTLDEINDEIALCRAGK
ncbi:MAG: hypothetical protein NC041_08455 [Bacteroides sp.]|nr:hypothetical protein [Prevotella sp.]MCM1408286.1 hypothetical protein [Treponema brennaborense]MCM1470482.1 hypothetical protein [Bacteroides sp.]